MNERIPLKTGATALAMQIQIWQWKKSQDKHKKLNTKQKRTCPGQIALVDSIHSWMKKTKLLTAEPTDRKNLNERKTKQKRRKLIQFVSFIRKNARWKWKSTEYSAEVCKSCVVFLRWNKIIPDLGIFLLVCFFHYIHDSVRLHFFSQNWNI